MKQLTTKEFVTQAKKIYGDKYDFSEVVYQNVHTKVRIICPIHGAFLALPHNFMKGHGCPTCGRQKITKEIFIERAQQKHGNRYDYSKVNYKRADEPVCIICPTHGEFWQKPTNHMQGHGCPSCFASTKSFTSDFVSKAQRIYGDKYDYSKADYQGSKKKVCIICPKHGEWWVTPNNFLRGSECPSCYGTPKYSNEEFVKKAKKVHGDKYDYSLVKYNGTKYKVRIICPIHGEFSQLAGGHLRGSGCPTCGRIKSFRSGFVYKEIP